MKDSPSIDKIWLDKVYFAYYSLYNKENNSHDIEQFIDWLYKQYGYVKPK